MAQTDAGLVCLFSRPQLGKALKDLDHTEFLALEKAMFGGLIACIRTIEVFSRAIEAILDDAKSVPPLSRS